MAKKSPKKTSKKTSKKKSKETSKNNTSETSSQNSTSVENCLINDMITKDDLFFDNENDTELIPLKEDNIIKKEDRISKNFLTKYELVRILGERTKQLKMGAKPLIKNYTDLSYEDIAIQELKHNMIPFKIKRPIGDKFEIWKLKELRKDHLSYYIN